MWEGTQELNRALGASNRTCSDRAWRSAPSLLQYYQSPAHSGSSSQEGIILILIVAMLDSLTPSSRHKTFCSVDNIFEDDFCQTGKAQKERGRFFPRSCAVCLMKNVVKKSE